jgi:hypothetical protein
VIVAWCTRGGILYEQTCCGQCPPPPPSQPRRGAGVIRSHTLLESPTQKRTERHTFSFGFAYTSTRGQSRASVSKGRAAGMQTSASDSPADLASSSARSSPKREPNMVATTTTADVCVLSECAWPSICHKPLNPLFSSKPRAFAAHVRVGWRRHFLSRRGVTGRWCARATSTPVWPLRSLLLEGVSRLGKVRLVSQSVSVY